MVTDSKQHSSFKTPRPKTSTSSKPVSKSSSSKSKQPAKRKSNAPLSIFSSSSPASATGGPEVELSSEPDCILAELVPESPRARARELLDDDIPKIPDGLVMTLLNNSFHDKKTKINRDAAKVMGKYVEVFVREALARSAFARGERETEGATDGFLEVEDLEKMGQQMILDF